MSAQPAPFTLAELCVCAAAEAWRDDGEVLATGIGLVPRLAASLAMATFNPDLMMTDGEAYLVSEPVPVGPRGDYRPKVEGWMPYARVFDNLWGGRRHAMVGPTQVDRWGQANISFIGADHRQPKVQLLGARGLPGNSIHHANSMFVPEHNRRVFVAGEVDMVASAGYHPKRFPAGAKTDFLEIRIIVTNLCVLDFAGPEHAIRLRSLHPGVSAEEVQENTGFPLSVPGEVPTTAAPLPEQLQLIEHLDPHQLRAGVFKDNPPGIRPR